ncbi:30S ribosome-binding factor RbfA [Litorilinea aerophila]|nr:30S ribosome-binding factor RbfA [Litorilinea aerophila]MCC9078060.1 30S ribosome-binding factor RbfA [Litorilinea aerophila]GIV76013.1 MAG: ribosome-binding factor A [Litorilinea sp.]
MPTIRQQRVAELLFEELSLVIGGELADPKLSLVTVTNVDVSRDLRHAKVYVSHDDEEVSRRELLRRLKRATPYMRAQIAARCNLRMVPELLFYYDDTPEKAARIDALLQQIAAERAAREQKGTWPQADAAGSVDTTEGQS